MDRKKYEAVEWYVNYAQMDLEKLGPGDRAKLEVEAGEYLLPADAEGKIALLKKILKKEYWVRHETSDGVIAVGEEFTWVKTLPSRNTPEYWKMIVNCQQTVLDCLKNVDKDRKSISCFPAYFFFRAKDEFQIEILTVTKNHAEYVLVRLARALEGLPVAFLQTCQSCGRIFFNPTKRTMKYCSSRCLSRFNAQKRRDADREGYNKKQREIMRKKYERDAKRKVNPNVKIARRKTKDSTDKVEA